MIDMETLQRASHCYRFNMVNSDDPTLKKQGLEPLYLKVYPTYFNPEGHIVYGGLDHSACILTRDIFNCLSLMHNNSPSKKFNQEIHFIIRDNKAIFNSDLALRAYNISNDSSKPKNYATCVQSLGLECLSPEEEYHSIELTDAEYFKLIIGEYQRQARPFKDYHELSGDIVRWCLNYNSTFFRKQNIPMEAKGIYNEKTMDLINSFKEAKRDIYYFFQDFAATANDWERIVKDLLLKFGMQYDSDSYSLEMMYYEAASDMLVQFLGFDKIETMVSKTITTSKTNIYEAFFVPILMGWNIQQIPRLVFDVERQEFKWIKPDDIFIFGNNRVCQEEIQLIKKYVAPEYHYLYANKSK